MTPTEVLETDRIAHDSNGIKREASLATAGALRSLKAVNESLALAEARTALAVTQAERRRVGGVSSQRGDSLNDRFGLSPFGTGGRHTVNPDGSVTPA